MKKIFNKQYNILKIFLFSLFIFLPNYSFAQIKDISSIGGILGDLVSFISESLVPLILTFALVFFIWKIVQFINKSDSEEERKKWKNTFIWGVIALFIMVSLIGIIMSIRGSLGIRTGDGLLPQLKEPPTQT